MINGAILMSVLLQKEVGYYVKIAIKIAGNCGFYGTRKYKIMT